MKPNRLNELMQQKVIPAQAVVTALSVIPDAFSVIPDVFSVIPAEAGIHKALVAKSWIPAFAGMTGDRGMTERAGSTGRLRGSLLLLAVLTAAGCGEISRNHAEVVAARLITEDGTELASVVPVPDGDVIVVESRFYDASGDQLDLRFPEHATEIMSTPTELLTVRLVAEEPFRRELTIRTPCAEESPSLMIGYGHWGRGDERAFGPLGVQPVDEVGRIELFGPGGVQLTPDVRLPFDEPLRVEVRFFGCDDVEISDVPANRSIVIERSDPAMLEIEAVVGERFMYDVTAVQPVGTTGEITIGYGTEERPELRMVGPFSVEVVEALPPEPPEKPVTEPEEG